MKYSENYGFALPTHEDDTLADIGEISKNFETVDRVMKKNEDLGTELNRFEAETMTAVGRLNTKDADLQSQIDNLGGVDLSELQSQIDTKIEQVNGRTGKSIAITANDIASVGSNTNLAMDVSLLDGKVDKINAHLGEQTSSKTIHELINTKVTKVDGKGLSTNDYNDSAKDKVSKIGNTNLIPSGSRYIVQWIQDVYDSVFTSSADNTCLADRVAAEISHRQSGDENLQSQIDALGGVDVSELQTDINHLQEKVNVMNGDIGDWIGSDTVYQAVTKLKAKDTDLQSQIDNLGGVDVSELETDIETLKTNVSKLQSADATVMDRLGRLITADENLQSQLDTKATRKVAVVGSDSYDSDGWYKVASGTIPRYQAMSLLFAVHTPAKSGKYSGILQLDLRGGAEAIVTGDEIKLGWLVRTGFDLSQVIITVDGYNWALYYNLRSNQNFRVFFEVIQESDAIVNKAIYNLHTDSVVEATTPVATATSTDLGTVNTANKLTTARNINGIAFDGSKDINITADDIASVSSNANLAADIGVLDSDINEINAHLGARTSGKTIHQLIADLTARIEALENSAS